MSAVLALLAAASFAIGSALQQRGTLEAPSPEGDPHFLAEIIRRPIWWMGATCQAVGWLLQALALARGTLVVVQSLCALSLVFALPAGTWLTDQHVDRRAVAGAVTAFAGIVGFVLVGEPSGGIDHPSARGWLVAIAISVALMACLAVTALRQRGPLSATLFATAAGICFGVQAALTKEWVSDLGEGLGHVLSTWTTYALIVSALGGFALQQSALKTGFLAPAMAASNTATLIASVVLGIVLFEEVLDGAALHPALTLASLTAGVVGVIILAAPSAAAQTAGDERPAP